MNLETYPNFDQMLFAANSPDKQTRENAEGEIRNCLNDDITKFIVSLMKEISNAKNQPEVLMMASIVFRNSIMKSQRDENGNGIWTGGLDEQLRGHIKDALLSNLGIDDKMIAKLAGQCIAAIASEELPRGQWGELIENLVKNCTGNEQNYQVRLAAIQTLGYICDDIDPTCLSNSKELVEQILHGTTFNIIPEQLEITQNASKALMRAMPVTGPYFEADTHRAIIMDGLLKAARIDDDEVQENALQALIEVPKIGFQFLVQHLPDIGRLTIETMEKSNNKALIYLLEFWENMCREEMERNRQGNTHSNMGSCWKDVLQIALQSSCQVEFSANEQQIADGSEEENSVTAAAARLLNALAPLVKIHLWEEADSFLKEKLVNGQNWIDRYIGFQTLGSIVISCEEEPKLLEQYVQGTINLLTEDNPPRIKLVAIWTLNSISQFAPQLLMVQDHIDLVVKLLIQSIQVDHPRIKTHSALTLKNMFVFADETKNTKIMNPYLQDVYKTIEEQIFMPNAVLQTSFTGFIDSVNTIFEVCESQNRSIENLGHLLEKIQTVLSNPQTLGQGTNVEQLEVFLNNYCGLAQIILASVKIPSEEYCSNIIDLIIAMFNTLNNKVSTGGLIMLNGLVHSIEDNIQLYIDKLGPFIVRGTQLNQEQCDHQVCRLSIGLISDISNNLQQQIQPYLQPFFECVEDVLVNNNHETASKIVAIIAVGDLCLASENGYGPYIEKTFNSIRTAAEMSLDVNNVNQEDYEALQDMSSLREAVIDAYLSMLHGMNFQDTSNQQPISIQQKEEYAMQMFQFLEALVLNGQNYNLNEQIVKSIFELFTDLTLACFEKESNGRPQANYNRMINLIKGSKLPEMMPNAKHLLGQDESSQELIGRFDEVSQMIAQSN